MITAFFGNAAMICAGFIEGFAAFLLEDILIGHEYGLLLLEVGVLPAFACSRSQSLSKLLDGFLGVIAVFC